MKWTLEKRRALQRGVQAGMTVTALAEVFSVSRPTVIEELKRGVSKERFANKDYTGYDIGEAILNYLTEKTGDEEQGETIIELLKANERRRSETIHN